MPLTVHLSRWSAWAPGISGPEDWLAWAGGSRAIELSAANPPLAHLDAMFKRRLSQLSRMILQVGHELAAGQEVPLVFASQWGEVAQQYKIAKNLIESGEVAPAAFSLSVFNTPVALLSISEKNHQRGSALYGGAASFSLALLEAMALTSQGAAQVLLLCGDELVPEAWQSLLPGPVQPHALGLLLSATPVPGSLALRVETRGGLPATAGAESAGQSDSSQALRFLHWFLSGHAGSLELVHQGFGLDIKAG